MRKLIWVVAAAAGLAAPAAGQVARAPDLGYVTVVEPRAWTGEGVALGDRGENGIVFTGQRFRVRGNAFHPSGIQRVEVNGASTVLLPGENGVVNFTTTLAAEASSRTVRIVAYPVQGDPIVRVKEPSREWTYSLPTPATTALAGTAGLGTGRALKVSVAALSPASQGAIVGALRGEPRIALQQGPGTNLSVRRADGEFVVTGADGSVRHRVRAPAEGKVDSLISVLMQEYGALQLVELPAPAATFGLGFSFPNGSDFHLGQGIEFSVRPARKGYLTVVDLGTNGVMGVLYPTPADEAQVAAGREIRLPTPAARTLFAPQTPYITAEPTGTGIVRAFVTPRPMQLPDASSGPVSADALLRALREATSGNEPWATATLTYQIVP